MFIKRLTFIKQFRLLHFNRNIVADKDNEIKTFTIEILINFSFFC